MSKESIKNKVLSKEDIMKLLDTCYEKCTNGIPYVSPAVQDLADDYLKKYHDPYKAAKAMIKNQIIKCTTSGFLTGFGGLITLPVTIPANIGSVLYVQMRMIAATAYLADYDLTSDQTQTFVYACLAGVSVNEIIKQAGINFGVKLAKASIEKIPGKVLTQINQKVGFRFLTKFGEKGIVNIGKMIPVAGAVIGGGLDFAETKIIADRSINWFFNDNFEAKTEDIIPVEYTDVETDSIDPICIPEEVLCEKECNIETLRNTSEQNEKNEPKPFEKTHGTFIEKTKSLLIEGKEKAGNGLYAVKDKIGEIDVEKVKNKMQSINNKAIKGIEDIKNNLGKKSSGRNTDGIISSIEKLALLKDSGVITQEEFDIKKAELLARI